MTNVSDDKPTTISINDLEESSDEQAIDQASPALHDSASASGHAADLETDDDVDILGQTSGLTYDEQEPLGIDSKISYSTKSEPPSEDTPY